MTVKRVQRSSPDETSWLPAASELTQAPHLLVYALSMHRCGEQRTHARSPELEQAVRDGEFRISDLRVPRTLDAPQGEIRLLQQVEQTYERLPHWVLKRHAWILAAAMMPTAEIQTEVITAPGRRRKRADLIAQERSSGRTHVFECGAVCNEAIFVALEAGHQHVIVLPYRGLVESAVRGYVFSAADAPIVPAPGLDALRKTAAAFASVIPNLLSGDAASPCDVGLASWLDCATPAID